MILLDMGDLVFFFICVICCVLGWNMYLLIAQSLYR